MTLSPTRRKLLASSLAILYSIRHSQANERLPKSPVRLLVGFAPGGGTDIMARLIAQYINERGLIKVIVENRPGANGMIAAQAVARAPADGTSIMLASTTTMVFTKLTSDKLPIDPLSDLKRIAQLGVLRAAIVAAPSLGVKTLAELVSWCKANPNMANYGATAMGSPPHFTGVMLSRISGIKMTIVPYKGAAPLVTDLAGGHIAAGGGALSDFLQHHRSGRLVILGISGDNRSPSAPDLMTFAEAGFPQITGGAFTGFFAPTGTPLPIMAALEDEISAVRALPVVRERLLALGAEVAYASGDTFAKLLAEDYKTWKPVVEASGFKAE